MKLPIAIFFLLFVCGCAPTDDPVVRAWLAARDDRELNSLHTGIALIYDKESESARGAIRSFLQAEPGTKQLGPVIEEVHTPTYTSYIFRANRNGEDGFVFLFKNQTKDRLSWSGRFIPTNYFDER